MGKLIVLEGTDGSGKSTQFRLMAERLTQENKEFRRLVFPRYDQESSALIRMYLGGIRHQTIGCECIRSFCILRGRSLCILQTGLGTMV